MGLAKCRTLKATYILADGLRIRGMGWENKFIRMVRSIEDNGWIISIKVLESILMKLVIGAG